MVTEAPLQMRDSSLHTYLQIYQEDTSKIQLKLATFATMLYYLERTSY